MELSEVFVTRKTTRGLWSALGVFLIVNAIFLWFYLKTNKSSDSYYIEINKHKTTSFALFNKLSAGRFSESDLLDEGNNWVERHQGILSRLRNLTNLNLSNNFEISDWEDQLNRDALVFANPQRSSNVSFNRDPVSLERYLQNLDLSVEFVKSSFDSLIKWLVLTEVLFNLIAFTILWMFLRGNHKSLNKIAEDNISSLIQGDNQLFGLINQEANIGFWEINLEEGSVFWSEKTREIHEYKSKDLPSLDEALNYFSGKDRQKLQDAIDRAYQNGQTFDLELQLTTGEGNVRYVRTIGIPLSRSGKAKYLYGLIQDITEAMQMTFRLHEREQFIQNLTDSIPGAVLKYKIDPSGKDSLLYISQQVEDLWEISHEDAVGDVNSIWKLTFPVDLPAMQNSIMQSAKDLSFWNHEWRIRTKSGKIKWLNGRGNPTKMADGSIVWDTFIFDVTKRMQYFEQLQSERVRANNLIESANAGSWIWNIQTGSLEVNDKWAEIAGYSRQDLAPIGIETWLKLAHPEDLRKSNKALEDHFAQKTEFYECEVRMKHKNGDWVWVLDKGKVTDWTEKGEPLMMYGTHVDITYLKDIEQSLIESEARYRSLTEMAPVGILVHTSDEIKFVNPHGLSLLEAEDVSALANLKPMDLIYADDQPLAVQRIRRLLENTSTYEAPESERVVALTGQIKEMLISGIRIKYDKEYAICTVFTDISNLKETQRKLETTLAEKNALFKELHHRVKNNLQLVSAILSLNAMDTQHKELKNFIADTNSRILSVAKIHDQLLGAEAIEHLDIKPYLESLIDNIIQSNAYKPHLYQVETEIENMDMVLDKALMLGLIVNEALSNSIKYAYPMDEGGKIFISLKSIGEQIRLTCRDYGGGISDDQSISPKHSSGLQLIEMFTKQIHGELQKSTKNGVNYTINFK